MQKILLSFQSRKWEICLLCRQTHANLNRLATPAWKARVLPATGTHVFWRKINSDISCKWQYVWAILWAWLLLPKISTDDFQDLKSDLLNIYASDVCDKMFLWLQYYTDKTSPLQLFRLWTSFRCLLPASTSNYCRQSRISNYHNFQMLPGCKDNFCLPCRKQDLPYLCINCLILLESSNSTQWQKQHFPEDMLSHVQNRPTPK